MEEQKRTIVVPEAIAQKAEEIRLREMKDKGVRYTLGNVFAMGVNKLYNEGA